MSVPRPRNDLLPRLCHEQPRGRDGAPIDVLGGISWRRPALAFAAVGVVMGNSLRRPLRGAWDETDLAWSALYALLAGCLAIPYHLWHCRARRQEFDNLALIRGDTLFVFAQPGREQRIPLLGVTRVVQGASGDAGTAITTERAGAMLDADFTLELQADSAARVVEFANACLPPPPEMRMERP